jgi:hypothetical protein
MLQPTCAGGASAASARTLRFPMSMAAAGDADLGPITVSFHVPDGRPRSIRVKSLASCASLRNARMTSRLSVVYRPCR